MNFKTLIKPRHVRVDEETLSPTFGRFIAEPLERGFGVTIGNSLRRLLLSSIPGAAVVSVRIADIPHEYTTMDGVKEDVADIILNMKSLNIKMPANVPGAMVYLEKTGPGVVTAADIELPREIEILNPDQPIATLAENATLQMEINIGVGHGYVPGGEFKKDPDDIGLIPLDAAFSPVRNVRYEIKAARVGQRTDFDQLVLDITTNGTITPHEALSYASSLLKSHTDMFIRPGEEIESSKETVEEGEAIMPASQLEEKLDKSIEELELSVRSFNCLEAAGIKTIRDLVQKSESEMLKYRNFGRKSLTEIKNILKDMNLSFNMKLDETGMPVSAPEKE